MDVVRGVVYVTGSTYGSLFPTNKGDADVWLAKYDVHTGALLAGIQYGSHSYSYGGRVTVLPGGETIEVRGKTGGSTFIFPGDGSFFIAIHNASTLALISGNQSTVDSGSGPTSATINNVLYQCGTTSESLYANNLGNTDYWVKKVCSSSSSTALLVGLVL